MAHSSLIGIDRAALEPAGRYISALGPSDNSDSGSDTVGIGEQQTNDPTEPVDVALRDDSYGGSPSMDDGSGSNSAGTGERRSAGADDGEREGNDISVDRVFNPAAKDDDDSSMSESDLAAIKNAALEEGLDDDEATDDELVVQRRLPW